MMSKECNKVSFARAACGAVALVFASLPGAADGATVRVWPDVVVSGDEVTLGDICDLSDLEPAERAVLATERVIAAPPPGGSTTVSAADVQRALRRGGANLASVALAGATRAVVSRPRMPESTADRASASRTGSPKTLRDAVRRAFERHMKGLGGSVDLEFGRTSAQSLELSEPEYAFNVRIRGGRRVGRMIAVDVDVHREGEQLRTVHLVVNSMVRKQIVVAKRAINTKAAVRLEDVAIEERLYERSNDLGIASLDAVVGQRARRFIPAGSGIRPSDLEAVPLVRRGQLVDVLSVSGGIEVRSVAKAVSAGGFGEKVELQIGGRRGQRLVGVVAGAQRVVIGRAGSTVAPQTGLQLALGENHAE